MRRDAREPMGGVGDAPRDVGAVLDVANREGDRLVSVLGPREDPLDALPAVGDAARAICVLVLLGVDRRQGAP